MRKWSDFAKGALASTITALSGTLTLATGKGALFKTVVGRGTPGSAPDFFVVTIRDGAGNYEKIKVEHHTAASDVLGSVGFPLVRGYDGTTAQAWTAGTNVIVSIAADKSFYEDASAKIGALGAAAIMFGTKDSTTSGLTYGYIGGQIAADGVLSTIADGTVSLTPSTTNYVERDQVGAVSFNTTGFSADKFPMAEVVTNATDITSITDRRYLNVELTGLVSKSVAGSTDVTLSAAESRAGIIEFTGAITANINAILPKIKRRFVVLNNTTGAFTLTAKGSTGTGVALTQGKATMIYFDGTNFRSAIDGAVPAGVYEPVDPNIARLNVQQSYSKAQRATPAPLTHNTAWDATTIQAATVDLNGSNFTVANPSVQPAAGWYFTVYAKYTTAHALSWGTSYKGISSFTPAGTAGSKTHYTFRSDGTNNECVGYADNVGA